MRQLQRLEPLPAHVRMPSDIEMTRSNTPWKRDCSVCKGTKTFKMWAGKPLESEIVEYECSCDEQLILFRWMSVRGIPLAHQQLRWVDVTAIPAETMQQVIAVWNGLESDIGHGLGVVFHGTAMTGKSMLVYLLARKLMFTGQFNVLGTGAINVNELDWKDADLMDWWYHRVLPAEVLVYDKLGFERTTYHQGKVEELFAYRNDNKLATLVTTTFSPDDLRKRHGSKVEEGVEEGAHGPVYAPQAADLIETRCHRIHIPVGSALDVTENFERTVKESRLGISRPFTFG